MLMHCKNCGQIVETRTKTYSHRHTEISAPNMEYTEYEVCGECGSSDLEDTDNCPVCGELKGISEPVCAYCKSIIQDDINALAKDLKINIEELLDIIYELDN